MRFRPWAWTFQQAWPKPAAVALTLLALGWVVVTTVFMGLGAFENDEGLGLVVFTAGVFGAGPGLVAILIAVLLAGGWPARTGVLAVGTCLAALAIPGMAAIGTDTPLGAAVLLVAAGAVPMAVVGLVALFGLVRSVREIREGLAEQRRHYVDRVLDTKGCAWLDDLARVAATSGDDLRGWLSDVDAELDPEAPLVWRPAHRQRQVDALVAMAASHGRVHRADLADELKLRSDVVPVLLHHVVREGRLTGFVDWSEGVVVTTEVPDTAHCPRCGGDMELAGAKVVQCRHCDAEVFSKSDS